MSTTWKSTSIKEVKVGDVVRLHTGDELTVSRIEPTFMGMDTMVAFIEDTSVRWLKAPQPADGQIDVKAC